MRPGDQPARGRFLASGARDGLLRLGARTGRARLSKAVVATPLIAVALLSACGDPGAGSSRADVVTTGPEPGAEIATTPADGTTPAGTTPADEKEKRTGAKDERRTGNDADRKGDAPSPTPTPTPSPTPKAASAARDAEPTIMPAQTLKPKAPTDGMDRAYVREMMLVISAGNLLAQDAELRGHRAELRAFATKLVKRAYIALNTLTPWGDELGDFLTQASNPRYVAGDLRTLGASADAMEPTRKLILLEHPPFEDKDGEAYDAAMLDAMIEQHETAIDISAGTIQTAGSTKFKRFAIKYERAKRKELEQLRAFERDL